MLPCDASWSDRVFFIFPRVGHRGTTHTTQCGSKPITRPNDPWREPRRQVFRDVLYQQIAGEIDECRSLAGQFVQTDNQETVRNDGQRRVVRADGRVVRISFAGAEQQAYTFLVRSRIGWRAT